MVIGLSLLPLLLLPISAQDATVSALGSLFWCDYDHDGQADLWISESDGSGRLLRGLAGGTFEDVTLRSGLDLVSGCHRTAWCDYDGDGLQDVLLCSWRGETRLMRQGAGGVFRDVTREAGLPAKLEALYASWNDFTGDGSPDLYVLAADSERVFENQGEQGLRELDLGQPAAAPWFQLEGAQRGQAHGRVALPPPPATGFLPGSPGVVGTTNLFTCVESMRDQTGAGSCLMASSVPSMGMLYPLSAELFVDSLSGFVGIGTTLPTERLDVAGNLHVDGQLISSAPSGAPLSVQSAERVTNLNADLLDGLSSESFSQLGSSIGAGELEPGAVTDGDIAAGAVGSLEVADGSLSAIDLAAGAIDNAALGPDSVTSVEIVDGAVDSVDLALNAVGSSAIATGAVTADEIADGTVNSAELATGSVNATHLAAGSVDSGALAFGSVDTSALAADAVTAAAIADGSVGAAELAIDAVGASAIATGAVAADEIADGSVGSAELATGSVNATHLAAGSVDSGALAFGSVDTAALAANAVTAAAIADGSVGAAELAIDAVGSSAIATGAVAADEIADGSVGSAELATGSVNATHLAAGSVDSGALASGSVDTAALAANAVTAAAIADGSVGAAELAIDAVSSSAIATGAVSSDEIADGSVGSAELATGSVNATHLALASVSSGALAAGSVGSAALATDAVDASSIQDGSVGAAELAADSVDASKVADGTLTNADISASAAIVGSKLLPSFGSQDVSALGGARFELGGTAEAALAGLDGLSGTGGYQAVRGSLAFDGIPGLDLGGQLIGGLGVALSGSADEDIGLLGHGEDAGVRAELSGSADTFAELATASGYGVLASGTSAAVRGEDDLDPGTWGELGAGTYGVRGVGSLAGILGGDMTGVVFDGVRGWTNNSLGWAVYGHNYSLVGPTARGLYGRSDSASADAVYAAGTFTATGTKMFAQPHPTDPTREIRFVCLEGNEAGTYFRGSGRLSKGRAEIEVPEEFRLASAAEGLTVQVTAVGGPGQLWVERKSLERIVVRGDADVEFDYFVNGLRLGHENHQSLRENTSFVPERGDTNFSRQFSPGLRKLLEQNGILNADGSPNLTTLERLDRELEWRQQGTRDDR